jgi:hypothetical protein
MKCSALKHEKRGPAAALNFQDIKLEGAERTFSGLYI